DISTVGSGRSLRPSFCGSEIAGRPPPMTNTLAAAEAIANARHHRTPLKPLAADSAPRDEAEGYRIQQALRELLSAEFGPLVGYKIGCTSAVMQQYLDIPHP